jgi:L,D-transpeptidase ErfK/SrfK
MQQWLSFMIRRPGVFSGARRVVVAAMLAAAAQTAGAETYTLVGSSELIGALATTRASYEDTFSAIGQRSGLGYEEMIRANPGVDPWLPGEGAEVLLPTQYVLPPGIREGILVNVAEYRLYFFRRVNGVPSVSTFPVSIGRMDWSTPIGRHRIAAKQVLPSWYPPESIRAEHAANGDHLPKVVPPGPKNPLGEHAMRLSVASYLIHGTNNPVGIGMQVTHGCIRMYPQDIRWIFPQVPVGTTVEIVNQPYKFGWSGDELYLEVHPSLEGDTHAETHGMTLVTEAYVRATATRPARIDWDLVEEAYRGKLGIPVRVGTAVPVEADAPM